MNLLVVGLSVGGAIGDNLNLFIKYVSAQANLYLITAKRLKTDESFIKHHNVLKLNYHKKNPLSFFSILNILKIISFVRSNQIDLIQFHSSHPVNIIISLLFPRIPQVYLWHDPKPHSGESIFIRAIIYLHDTVLIINARKIIVTSKNIYSYLKDTGFKKIDQVCPIYLGALENLFFSDLASSVKYDLCFFGRVEAYKGLDTLTSAIEILRKQNFNIYSVYAGPGNYQENYPGLLEKAAKLNICIINEYLVDKDLAAIIASCKLIVFPYKDATGTQTIQACYYYQKPVIATNTGAFPEYIIDGKTGLIVKPENPKQLAEAIKRLLNDESERNRMGSNGKSRLLEVFDNQVIHRQFLDVYHNLLIDKEKDQIKH